MRVGGDKNVYKEEEGFRALAAKHLGPLLLASYLKLLLRLIKVNELRIVMKR